MSEGIILKALEKQDQRLDKIEVTLGSISQELKKHGKTLAEHGKILSDHGRILSEHSQTLADHDEQPAFIREYLGEKVLTKQEYLEGQEQIMTALKDLRQEIPFTHGWLRRHDENFVKLNIGLV